MSGNVRYVLFLVIVAAVAVVAYDHARSITFSGAGLIVGVLFQRWFNAYHKTHRIAKWAEVLADGFFLLVVSTVFVTLCSTFFKTLKKDIPRDPLVTAIAQDSGERLLEVLAGKELADPGVKKVRVDKMDEQGRTPLMWAAYADFAGSKRTAETDDQRVLLVDLLGKAGADPNARDKDGWTPLTWAAWSGLTKVAARLLDLGAQVDVADRQGQTPLMIAALRGHSEIAKLLVSHGAQKTATAKDGRTARAFAEEGRKAYPHRSEAYQAALSVL
jgi:hypothetical protein